ncbi:hypothetical protein SK128_017567 [Halocaridina rubra]|uniref:Bestrophin homolog n=1 Tax=Halocaridina rubra TaxID=373956 RepID=A0AAN8X1T4_HALRR
MTVKYTDKVASHGGFGSFFKLLVRWRGSVYKMVWQDMLAYIVMYYFISLIYRFALSEDHKRTFESLVIHCARFRSLIPVSFVLGFYVSLVVSRWWGTYQTLPWPSSLVIAVRTYIPGQDEESKMVRAAILRYVNLTIALTFAMISPAVKKRLPSLHHLVAAGYLTESERVILENLEKKSKLHKTWIPIAWACKTVQKARKKDVIQSDSDQRMIITEIMSLKSRCGGLLGYSEYNIPLVYTQVVTIAVYSFFFFSLLGEQYLDPNKLYPGHGIDLYFPFFAFLQVFFYIGWIKVAEALLNPFGEDDHDFEFNLMLQGHVEMCILLSEAEQDELPQYLRDSPESDLPSSTNNQQQMLSEHA